MAELRFKRRLLDGPQITRALDRMALEIIEQNGGVENVALVGIHTDGVPLAHRLAERIGRHAGPVQVGMIDITLYRDDVFLGLPQPVVGETALPFDVSGKRVVLIDDVLYSGRTVRAALDALVDFGRPRGIHLAVLVDRGRRELPIQADVVGLTVATEANQSVEVRLTELGDPEDVANLLEKA